MLVQINRLIKDVAKLITLAMISPLGLAASYLMTWQNQPFSYLV
jgi:hypothetical protein